MSDTQKNGTILYAVFRSTDGETYVLLHSWRAYVKNASNPPD